MIFSKFLAKDFFPLKVVLGRGQTMSDHGFYQKDHQGPLTLRLDLFEKY